jgi:hypothetical protein
MSSESSTGRSLSRGGAGGRRAGLDGGSLHAFPHVDGLVAVHAEHRAQVREGLRRQQARRHVEVVRRPHRREHLALAIADLAAHGRQDLRPHDAVGGEAVEAVALDHLQVEEASRDREEGGEHEQAERPRAPAHLGKLGVLSGDLHPLTAG